MNCGRTTTVLHYKGKFVYSQNSIKSSYQKIWHPADSRASVGPVHSWCNSSHYTGQNTQNGPQTGSTFTMLTITTGFCTLFLYIAIARILHVNAVRAVQWINSTTTTYCGTTDQKLQVPHCPRAVQIGALPSILTRPDTPSEKYGLALTAFAAWRVDISHTAGFTSKYFSSFCRCQTRLLFRARHVSVAVSNVYDIWLLIRTIRVGNRCSLCS